MDAAINPNRSVIPTQKFCNGNREFLSFLPVSAKKHLPGMSIMSVASVYSRFPL